MMTASVLAKRADVPLFTVRYYTRIGLLKPSRDLRNGYKIYRPGDKDRLRFITSAKNLGFTLNEIEEILDHATEGDSPCPMVREIVQRRIEENKAKIQELKKPPKTARKGCRRLGIDGELRAGWSLGVQADRIVFGRRYCRGLT